MEGKFDVILVVMLVVAATVYGSSAQTTHVVGDSMGWLIPPGGEAAYSAWAANRSFVVGDVLEFRFGTSHDVAEVSKASYDSCNPNNPDSITRTGPARINLTSPGEHHFICTVSGHCNQGQKLAINVSAASAPQPTSSPPAAAPQPTSSPPAPAPQTSTPPPVDAPAPAPTRAAVTYTVGDSLGWTVPPGGPTAYRTWARGKKFAIGDTLVFNFTNGRHDVVQVTRAEFDSCRVSTTTTPPITASPARIRLNSTGDHYYICTFPQHCSLGQKLAINATSSGSTAAPSPSSGGQSSPSPATSPPPPSSSAPSAAVAALSLTLLTVAVAFLHN